MPAFGRQTVLVLSLVATISLFACAWGGPDGPAYETLSPPDPSSTLVYIYRLDTVRGVAAADVKLDEDKIVTLRNGEYVAIVLDPGTHEFEVGLLWLGIFARSWSGLEIETTGGETVYIRLRAATEEILAPSVRDSDLPGRADRMAGVGLFVGVVDSGDAETDLAAMRRATLR